MTELELLELAAKAAGIELRWHPDGTAYSDSRCAGYWGVWNPLTDDGDALRLAVKLSIYIQPFTESCVPSVFARGMNSIGTEQVIALGNDPCAATRRAIVRAAAEIGRSME